MECADSHQRRRPFGADHERELVDANAAGVPPTFQVACFSVAVAANRRHTYTRPRRDLGARVPLPSRPDPEAGAGRDKHHLSTRCVQGERHGDLGLASERLAKRVHVRSYAVGKVVETLRNGSLSLPPP
jgi:hypothetical protein